MKNRLLVIWLAGLTVYNTYTANDTYRVLKNLESGQYCTMKYMEKSTGILVKLKKLPFLAGVPAVEDGQKTASAAVAMAGRN